MVNLSERHLTPMEINVLKRGINFCSTQRMNLAQVRIDLYLYIRKIKLAKFFKDNKNKKTKQDQISSEYPSSTLKVKDANNCLMLLNLNTLKGEEIPLEQACSQKGAGLSALHKKSKFYPQLPPGNKADLFQE